MGIERKFDLGAIEEGLRKFPERVERSLVNTLNYVGEQCVNAAKSLPSPSADSFPTFPKIPSHTPNYIDWSANLKSSIGYVVVVDGEVVSGQDSFKAVEGRDGVGDEGARKGLEYAMEMAGNYKTGIVLILVAGMHYAAYVQSKGYDVLNSAVIKAEELIPTLLGQLEGIIKEEYESFFNG